jgi:ABC-2 type transport system ATP-binding protein
MAEPTSPDLSGGSDHAPRTAVLQAQGLAKRYGRRPALRNVSLELRAGELVALVGPNGAGKTTLLSILAGLLRSDGGTVDRAPDDIGWVPQQAALYSKLTVRENLRLFARLERARGRARGGEKRGSARRPEVEATVERMLDQTGLSERADDGVGQLSGGNRQRVNVAIGLLADPEVLLLDEPSAALDPRQRARLWHFIAERAAEGTAVLYSTHDVHDVERHADRVLVIAGGELLFSGAPAELELAGGAGGVESALLAFLDARGH